MQAADKPAVLLRKLFDQSLRNCLVLAVGKVQRVCCQPTVDAGDVDPRVALMHRFPNPAYFVFA